MPPISRCRALQLGGLASQRRPSGLPGLARTAAAGFISVEDAELVEPTVLRSTDGALDLRLEAAEAHVPMAGSEATTLSYNGSLPGPTLHLLQPGDHLRIELVNRLAEPTNLHVHGLAVSPQGNGDNSFIVLDPGRSFT